MLMGLKYCGNCHPNYARAPVRDALLEAVRVFAQIEYARPGQLYDALLVICGCTARCADCTDLRARHPILFLDRPEAVPAIVCRLRTWAAEPYPSGNEYPPL